MKHTIYRNYLYFLLFLLLFPLIFGFFYTPDSPITVTTFDEQKEELERELEQAKEDYPSLGESEVGQGRQRILFYETALKYRLPVWSDDFSFESASFYALLYREWEILEANPKAENEARRQFLNGQVQELSTILAQRDSQRYLSFYRNYLEAEDRAISPEEERNLLITALRADATEDGVLSGGESLTLSYIDSLEKSLTEGRDHFFPTAKGEPLSNQKKTLFATLSEYWQKQIREKRVNPIPANTETLFFFEEFGAYSLFLFALFFGEEIWRRGTGGRLLALSHLPLLAIALFVCVSHFAPGSRVPYPVVISGRIFPIPFAVGIFLRLSLKTLSLLPFLLLALIFKNKNQKKAPLYWFSFLVPLYSLLGFFLRLWLGSSSLLWFLPFCYTDLSTALLPHYPISIAMLPPWAVLLGFLLLCFLCCIPLLKRPTFFEKKVGTYLF